MQDNQPFNPAATYEDETITCGEAMRDFKQFGFVEDGTLFILKTGCAENLEQAEGIWSRMKHRCYLGSEVIQCYCNDDCECSTQMFEVVLVQGAGRSAFLRCPGCGTVDIIYLNMVERVEFQG